MKPISERSLGGYRVPAIGRGTASILEIISSETATTQPYCAHSSPRTYRGGSIVAAAQPRPVDRNSIAIPLPHQQKQAGRMPQDCYSL